MLNIALRFAQSLATGVLALIAFLINASANRILRPRNRHRAPGGGVFRLRGKTLVRASALSAFAVLSICVIATDARSQVEEIDVITGGSVRGTVDSGASDAADRNNWYRINMSDDRKLRLTLTELRADADMCLYFGGGYSSASRNAQINNSIINDVQNRGTCRNTRNHDYFLAGSSGSSGGDSLELNLQQGDYLLRVDGVSGGPTNYVLDYSTEEPIQIHFSTDQFISLNHLTVTELNPHGATYSVKITGAPNDFIGAPDVTVTPVSLYEYIRFSPSVINFTRSDWMTAKDITVYGLRDEDSTSYSGVPFNHRVSGLLLGGREFTEGGEFVMSIIDVDNAAVIVDPTTRIILPEGESKTYTVRLYSRPSEEVEVTVEFADSAISVEPATLTFTPWNWSARQTVTVTALYDPDTEGEMVELTHVARSPGDITGYEYLEDTARLTVIVNDRLRVMEGVPSDTEGVTIAPRRLNLSEGDSGTYAVKLDSRPATSVTVTIEPAGSTARLEISPTTLTFTPANWDANQTVSARARDDDTAGGNASVTLRHSVSGLGNVTDAGEVTIAIADDDRPGVALSVGESGLDIAENDNGAYTVSLTSRPSGTVTINAASDNPDAAVSPATLSFTAESWNMPQTVTVTVARDDDGDSETATIRHTVTGYGNVTDGGSVAVRIADTYRVGPDPAERQAVEAIVEDVASGVVSNVTANVGARFSSAGGGGAVLSLAGQPAPLDAAAAAFAKDDAPRGASSRLGYEGEERWRRVSFDQLLGASAFELALGAAEGETGGGAAQWTLWGRGDILFFDNDAATARYDGDLKAGYLGIDAWLDDRWLAGVAVSRSMVESDYALEDGAGELDLALTGAHPYVRYAPGGGGELWAILGAGMGEIENRRRDAGRTEKSDVTMYMAAAGARQALETDGDFALAVLADAGFGRLRGESGADLETLDSLSVNSWRARLGAEVSAPVPLEGGDSVTPFVEVAGRYDGGGDDRDAGIEVSGGLLYADPASGFGVEARGRALALYSGNDYREYGASLTASLTPGVGGAGLSLSLSPRLGANPAAGDALWRDDPFALAGSDRRAAALSFAAGVGYGVPVRALRGVATPFGEFDLLGDGRRARTGLRFANSGGVGAASVELAGERLTRGGRDPDHRIALTGRLRF